MQYEIARAEIQSRPAALSFPTLLFEAGVLVATAMVLAMTVGG